MSMATDKTDLDVTSSRRYRKRFKPVLENLRAYTANTTIHGIKYLGWKKRPIAEKIYWIVIFVICLSLLGIFIREIELKWRHKFVILAEDDTPTPIHKIPFPAVTICPHYKIKKSEFSYPVFNRLYQQRDNNFNAHHKLLMRYQLAQQLCIFKTTSAIAGMVLLEQDFLNKSHIELLHEISPKFEDIFSYVLDSKCNIKMNSLKISTTSFPITVDTFTTILTNEGVCFTLNLNPKIIRYENVQMDYPYLSNPSTKRGLCSASEVSRIKINLATNISNLDSMCQSTELGYKVILHSPEIYPSTFENYIAINHESLTRIKVQPKMITTSETLRTSYTPKQRQCYFIGERQLKFFNFYNRANCKLECFANYTLQVHGCVHFALPHSPGIPICSEPINYAELYELVDGLDSLLTYLHDYPEKSDGIKFERSNETFPRSCDCLFECNSIEYDYSMIVENFNFDKMLEEMNDGMGENRIVISSPSEFEIFWESPKFKGTIRKQLYTLTDLVSHFGGLLGLFMGASILSIFEIIYFCIVRHFTNKYWRR